MNADATCRPYALFVERDGDVLVQYSEMPDGFSPVRLMTAESRMYETMEEYGRKGFLVAWRHPEGTVWYAGSGLFSSLPRLTQYHSQRRVDNLLEREGDERVNAVWVYRFDETNLVDQVFLAEAVEYGATRVEEVAS